MVPKSQLAQNALNHKKEKEEKLLFETFFAQSQAKNAAAPLKNNHFKNNLPMKKEKKTALFATIVILSLLVIGCLSLLISNKKLSLSFTLASLPQKDSQAIVLPFKPSEEIDLLKNSQPQVQLLENRLAFSKIEAGQIILIAPAGVAETLVSLNFKQPIDFSQRYLVLKVKSIPANSRLGLIFRDENHISNALADEIIWLAEDFSQDNYKEVFIQPKDNHLRLDWQRVNQLRLVLAAAPDQKNLSKKIFIREIKAVK
jgi:hypothetical protein